MQSLQTTDCNENLFKMDDMVIFKNDKLINDLQSLQVFRELIPNFDKSFKNFGESRTIVFFKDNIVFGVYNLQIFNNVASCSILKVDTSELFLQHVDAILNFLTLTIKTNVKDIRLSNECNFRMFVYAPVQAGSPKFFKRLDPVKTTIFGDPIENNVEWRICLKFDEFFNRKLKEESVQFATQTPGFGTFNTNNIQNPYRTNPVPFGIQNPPNPQSFFGGQTQPPAFGTFNNTNTQPPAFGTFNNTNTQPPAFGTFNTNTQPPAFGTFNTNTQPPAFGMFPNNNTQPQTFGTFNNTNTQQLKPFGTSAKKF